MKGGRYGGVVHAKIIVYMHANNIGTQPLCMLVVLQTYEYQREIAREANAQQARVAMLQYTPSNPQRSLKRTTRREESEGIKR